MTDDASPYARATGALAEMFSGAAALADDFGSFERDALRSGHRYMAEATVACEGKRMRGGKARRRGCVHRALVGRPEEIWPRGGAAIAGLSNYAREVEDGIYVVPIRALCQ